MINILKFTQEIIDYLETRNSLTNIELEVLSSVREKKIKLQNQYDTLVSKLTLPVNLKVTGVIVSINPRKRKPNNDNQSYNNDIDSHYNRDIGNLTHVITIADISTNDNYEVLTSEKRISEDDECLVAENIANFVLNVHFRNKTGYKTSEESTNLTPDNDTYITLNKVSSISEFDLEKILSSKNFSNDLIFLTYRICYNAEMKIRNIKKKRIEQEEEKEKKNRPLF